MALPSNSSYLPAAANPFVTMELKDVDVLLGRGTGPSTWIGNLMFRDLVHSQVEAYNDGKPHSIIIAKNIISKVHERGGRFLRKLALTKKKKEALLSFAGVGPSCNGSNNKEFIYEIVTDMKILICKTKMAMRYSKKSKVLEVSSGTTARRQHVVEEAASLRAALPLLKSMENSSHHQGSIASSPSTNPFCPMDDALKSSKPIRKDSSGVGAVATYAAAAKSMVSRPHSPYIAYGMIDSNTLLSPSRAVPASSFGSLNATLVARLQLTDPILGLVTANPSCRSVSNVNRNLSDVRKKEHLMLMPLLGRQTSQEGRMVMSNIMASQQQAFAIRPPQVEPAHKTSAALSRFATTTSERMLLDESLLQYILRAKLRRAVEAKSLLTGQNKAAQSIREGVLLLEGLRRGSIRSSAISSQESSFLKSFPRYM